MDGHPARAGEDAPDGQCGTEPKQNCPYRAPVNGLLTAQQGKEIFQRDFRCNICLLRVTAVHQVGKGQPQRVGQWFQRVDVRQADSTLPSADGFIRYMKLFGQSGLCQPSGFPYPGEKCPERFRIHCAHILWKKDSIPRTKRQPTLCLPAPKHKSPAACSVNGQAAGDILYGVQKKNAGIRAYSWGPAETRALPCSLPSYFLKFLMKRPARSLAFSSHWEASA